MKQLLSEFTRGELTARYETDEQGHVGFLLLPTAVLHNRAEKDCAVEPLVQLYLRGDNLPPAYANGRTLCGSQSTMALRFNSQNVQDDRIITELADPRGYIVRHTLVLDGTLRAAQAFTEFENDSETDVTLEMLTSCSLGGLTPFEAGEGQNTLLLYTAKADWSTEGRFVEETVEDANLETSWAKHGVRVKKFGQCGSMPVRSQFPFLAVRDRRHNVSWAVQLACMGSWQLEARRKDFGLSISGGPADFDFGHWAKTVAPGKCFVTPKMYLTAVVGSAELAAQRLLELHEKYRPKNLSLPPVMFNEFCTTWGEPSQQNLAKIVRTLQGKGMEYLVIDAGWYKNETCSWSELGGDWEVDEKNLFPDGLQKTVDTIKAAGMIPGIWFEPETCAVQSKLHKRQEMLLTRNGTVIDTGARRFLDMRKPQVQAYLDEKVTGLLQKYGFGYIKVDYNDCIGVGCDGDESLGEGLRRNMEGVAAFYTRLRGQIPGIIMENCASGGHRLEPQFQSLFDMASFSDAHECVYIPIIAANLQRMILPIQSQIWAVLHGTDSLRRLHYSMVNTFLGVMCLSGDIYSLNNTQWKLIEQDIDFYRRVRPIIAHGISRIEQHGLTSYTDPQGWQAVIRTGENGETLVTVHTFGGVLPDTVRLRVPKSRILGVVCTEQNDVHVAGDMLCVDLKANFEAIAVHLG